MVVLKKLILRKAYDLQVQLLFPDRFLLIRGSYGVFSFPLFYELMYDKKEKKIWLVNSTANIQKKSFFVLQQILIRQACLGVLFLFRKQLNIVGIGYQAHVEKDSRKTFLVLKLGFSHQIRLRVPEFIKIICPKPRVILITGLNLQKVSNYASSVRSLRCPNAYKEKGIYYLGEKPRLKQGKKT